MSTETSLHPSLQARPEFPPHPSGLPYGSWQLIAHIPDLPDHTQLPCEDNVPVENATQGPQNDLLSDSLRPVLEHLHPDGRYFVGRDVGIYWQHTEPPLEGCRAPDWYYVPGVPATLEGRVRRSYVLWHERVPPALVLEFISRDGTEEHDRTPAIGSFWIYERIIQARYYGIFDPQTGHLEVQHLAAGRYQVLPPNEQGRYAIEPLGVQMGVWQGRCGNITGPWLRWWDQEGNLLLSGWEQADLTQQRAEAERQRADRLAERLRSLGIDPEQV